MLRPFVCVYNIIVLLVCVVCNPIQISITLNSLLNHFSNPCSNPLCFVGTYVLYVYLMPQFPMMPRHNLEAVEPYVKEYCKRTNIPFNEDSLVECVARNIRALNVNVNVDAEKLVGNNKLNKKKDV